MLEELEEERNKLTADFEEMKKNIQKVETDLMQMKNNLNALAGAIQLSNRLVDRREKGKYEIDGIIVSHNKYYKRVSDENPKYSFAFKSMHNVSMTHCTKFQES